MKAYEGLAASPGIAIGQAWIFRPQTPNIDTRTISEDEVKNEYRAFRNAQAKVDAHLEGLYNRVLEKQGEHEAAIFESHRELLADEELDNDIQALIRDERKTATAAVKEYLDQVAATMRNLEDEYLRERAAEFEDLQNNLLLALNGLPFASLASAPPDSIIFAEDLTPSETAQLDIEKVRGFVLEHGGLTSHVAILARNFGMPAVMGMRNIMNEVTSGITALLDGDTGHLVLDPDEQTRNIYTNKKAQQDAQKAEYAKLHGKPATTLDHKTFALYSNIGSPNDLHLIDENGSDGIGLFRSEFLFMESKQAPSEDQQYAIYRKVAEHMKGKTVILRLLDIGGDKPLSYLNFPKEENPFLGWRGVRLYKDNPEVFLSQIRAAIRAAAYGDLWVMIPMVISLEELRWVKQQIAEQSVKLEAEGRNHNPHLKVGIMIETPASALIAEQLATEAAFFSIGTNDLTQYTLAVDRGNTKISDLYDGLHPAVLRLMKMTCDAAHKAGIDVGICGEMGGQLEATPLLVGMGFNEISISGKMLPAVKYAISKLQYDECRTLLNNAIAAEDAEAVRKLLPGVKH
ncbi:phosphoenolpyruvate--protein phosphotransferase [Cardiobacterium sp. Marseille-Q4385]|uniref:phosphoenolpyruvate--protein phosphotransferase n=1 Tax=Cardiobacterium sp. Marseille-Q4385 TaxID=2866573 RepID=UPI001CE3B733|nr:phosphoenolpyruvate--protein phosphotransferase [Cardiobacterium sp. Marseille-Q4385]